MFAIVTFHSGMIINKVDIELVTDMFLSCIADDQGLSEVRHYPRNGEWSYMLGEKRDGEGEDYLCINIFFLLHVDSVSFTLADINAYVNRLDSIGYVAKYNNYQGISIRKKNVLDVC